LNVSKLAANMPLTGREPAYAKAVERLNVAIDLAERLLFWVDVPRKIIPHSKLQGHVEI
jgi:hypothetical protein